MSSAVIYTLRERDSNVIRYVGSTLNPCQESENRMSAPEKPQPWTRVHQCEARAEALRLSMLAMLADDSGKSWKLSGVFGVSVGVFGANLMIAGLAPDEVQAAIVRVRRLAEGEFVRETAWFLRYPGGAVSQDIHSSDRARGTIARSRAELSGARLVRVIRIRRAGP